MTLKQLIRELQEIADIRDDDPEVYSTSDYGDYHHTEQLDEIRTVEEAHPVASAYSRSGMAMPDDEDNSDEMTVIVLRYTRG